MGRWTVLALIGVGKTSVEDARREGERVQRGRRSVIRGRDRKRKDVGVAQSPSSGYFAARKKVKR